MRKSSKILAIVITLILTGLLLLQTGCGSSKYGMVPCPCSKKSSHR